MRRYDPPVDGTWGGAAFLFYTPLAGSRFCGTERLNHARKGLCDAGIAPRLLSAMFSEVCCMYRTLA